MSQENLTRPEPIPESFYELRCECGADIKSVSTKLQCPKCGRILVIEWRAEYSGGPPPAGTIELKGVKKF